MITIYFAFSIIKILIYDLNSLTEYGYGYLTGQLLLFIIFTFIICKIKFFKK